MSRRPRTLLAAWLLLLLVFAIWTRGPMVREGLWRDEAISVFAASAPSLSELVARNRISDYNPPLFDLLLAGYQRAAGSGEASLKLFALGLGLLTAAGTAALAWEIAGPMAAALAAAFVLNNPILLEMSTELRAYSLSAFLCAASLLVIFRLRRRASPTAGGFVVAAVLLTLLAYSHLAGVIVAACLGGWGLLLWRREPADPFGRRLAASAIAAGCAFLPWLPTAWEQFRSGIPWDSPQPAWDRFASLVHRSRESVPIPGGFRGPLLFVALAALGLLAVAETPRAAARLRQARERLLVTAAAGAAVCLALGLFSNQPRYLTIPAALFAVVLGALAALLFDAGRAGGRPVAAWTAVVALGLAAFWARADLYRERLGRAERSKSGVRDLCRAHPFTPGELVVAAPDYLAPTLWYYCGGREDLHGFVRWENPALFDPRGYPASWTDPLAASRGAERIGERLREARASRFALVFDESAQQPPLSYGRRVAELRGELARRYAAAPIGRFSGRLESVEAAELAAPGETR